MEESLANEEAAAAAIETVKDRIQGLLNDGMSQKQICRESGVKQGRLSPWLSGKYTGDNEAVERDLSLWLESRDRQAELAQILPEKPGWIETPTSKKITAVLAYSQMAGDIGCIYGGAGMSKTMTIKAYQERNPTVWVAEMDPCSSAVASTLEFVCDVAGINATAGRPVRMMSDLCKRIKDTGGLLVIDEAQHLRTQALEALRSIHDKTGIGMVLSGNESVYSRLTGGSRQASFAQLFSRIGKRLRLTHPSAGDIDKIAGFFEITGTEERRLCRDIAGKPGALRILTNTLRLAKMFAIGDGGSINATHIRMAWRDLGGAE